jgi:hypothetical protein
LTARVVLHPDLVHQLAPLLAPQRGRGKMAPIRKQKVNGMWQSTARANIARVSP